MCLEPAVNLSVTASERTWASYKIKRLLHASVICNDKTVIQLQPVLLCVCGLDAQIDNKEKHRDCYSDSVPSAPYQALYLRQHITL